MGICKYVKACKRVCRDMQGSWVVEIPFFLCIYGRNSIWSTKLAFISVELQAARPFSGPKAESPNPEL